MLKPISEPVQRLEIFTGAGRRRTWSADHASLIETCKLTHVEPFRHLADVTTRIVEGHPQSRLDELLPWAYVEVSEFKAVA